MVRKITRVQQIIENLESSEAQIADQLRENPRYQSAFKFKDVLEANKHLFQGQYFGPIASSIEVESENAASIAETLLGAGDLESFAFEFDRDRDIAFKLSGDGAKHAVNMLTLTKNSSHQDSALAKKRGFDGTVRDFIKMPDLLASYYAEKLDTPYKYVQTGTKIPDEFDDDQLLAERNHRSLFIFKTQIIFHMVQRAKFYTGTVAENRTIGKSSLLVVSNSSATKEKILFQQQALEELTQTKNSYEHKVDEFVEKRNDFERELKQEEQTLREVGEARDRLKGMNKEFKKLQRDRENMDNPIDMAKEKKIVQKEVATYTKKIRKSAETLKEAMIEKAKAIYDEHRRLFKFGTECLKRSLQEEERDALELKVHHLKEDYDSKLCEHKDKQEEVNVTMKEITKKFKKFIDRREKDRLKEKKESSLNAIIQAEITWLEDNGLHDIDLINAQVENCRRQLKDCDDIDEKAYEEFEATSKQQKEIENNIARLREDMNELMAQNRDKKRIWIDTMEKIGKF